MSEPVGKDKSVPESGFARFVVTRPVAVTMIVLAVCVFGWVSLTKLPVTLLPELSYPTVTVRTDYPGAAPAEVEELVTRPLEENLAVIPDLVGYRSISRAGGSDVILEFAWNTKMTFAVQDVREKVDQVLPRLPRGVERPLILRYDPTFDPILRLGLHGSDDLVRLRTFAEDDLRRRLETVPGVAAVKVKGGIEREIRIELDEARLRQAKLSPETINQRLQAENVNVAGGILRDGDVEYLVRTLNEFRTPAEIGDLAVGVQNGRPLRIADVGRVVDTGKERDVVTRIEGLESVEIEIFKEADANLVGVAQAVKERLYGKAWRTTLVDGRWKGEPPEPAEKPKFGMGGSGMSKPVPPLASMVPPGTKLDLLSDQSTFIESSIDEVKANAWEGALLSVIILFAFLRRAAPTLIIAIAIPLSILATFAPLLMQGVSLNVMSLGGLAIGVGMMVDDAIVVLEAITRRRDEGESPIAAAINGTREMGLAVSATTLTTIIVFLPIVFVDGVAGQVFRDQALAICWSLTASWVVSVGVVPMLTTLEVAPSNGSRGRFDLAALGRLAWPVRTASAQAFDDGRFAFPGVLYRLPMFVIQWPLEVATRLAGAALLLPLAVAGIVLIAAWRLCLKLLKWPLDLFDFGFTGFEKGIDALLRGALRRKAVTIGISLALVGSAWWGSQFLKHDLVPRVRQGLFFVECQFDIGTSIERTDERVRDLEASIRGALANAGVNVASLSTVAGVPRDTIAKPGDGPHTARVWVRLESTTDLGLVEDRAREIAVAAASRVAGAGTPLVDAPSLFQTRTPLEIEIVGNDVERLRRAATLVEKEIASMPGVMSARSTVRRGRPEVVVRYDREALARYDLRLGDVADAVRAKVAGNVPTRLADRDRRVDVRTRLPESAIPSVAALKDLQVNPGKTPAIPLSAVAALEIADGPAELRHVGGRRAEIVAADLAGIDLGGAAVAAESAIEAAMKADPSAFTGATARLAGQNEESARSTRSLLLALALAIFLTYLLMAAQFESLIHPLVIMLTLPLSLIGVVWALVATSTSVSVIVFMGAILLVGVVVDNAILLIDGINSLRREGMDRDPAILKATRLRLRPIAMTTGTTVLGLVPLALGLGDGAELRQPMAISVIAGITSSTLLTLVVIPAVYALFTDSGPIREVSEEAA